MKHFLGIVGVTALLAIAYLLGRQQTPPVVEAPVAFQVIHSSVGDDPSPVRRARLLPRERSAPADWREVESPRVEVFDSGYDRQVARREAQDALEEANRIQRGILVEMQNQRTYELIDRVQFEPIIPFR